MNTNWTDNKLRFLWKHQKNKNLEILFCISKLPLVKDIKRIIMYKVLLDGIDFFSSDNNFFDEAAENCYLDIFKYIHRNDVCPIGIYNIHFCHQLWKLIKMQKKD